MRTSPNARKKKVGSNVTFVDINQMTAGDLDRLEKSPPTIKPRRKHMKVMNNRAMSQFGSEAFNINLEREVVAPPRLNANR